MLLMILSTFHIPVIVGLVWAVDDYIAWGFLAKIEH